MFKRFAVVGIAVGFALLPGVAAAFDADNGNPPVLLQYSFQSGMGQAYKDRINNAASEWTTRSASSLFFAAGATNQVLFAALVDGQGNQFPADATLPCSGANCTLRLNIAYRDGDMWYTGVGNNPGTANCGGCPFQGFTRLDLWGVAVHELGHWLGLNHNLFGTCQGVGNPPALYAPLPTSEMASMCYATNQPAIEGGGGQAGIVPRRTISQDEIQGVRNIQNNYLDVNSDFNTCGPVGTTVMPQFWMASNTPNRWCQNGTVALNDNPTVPYPELFQRVRGQDADGDNDGTFAVQARVKATETETFEPARAVIFVRHIHGGAADHEVKCDSGNLPLNVWVTVNCGFSGGQPAIDLVNSAAAWEFEYGVRVTDRVEIDFIRVRDL